MRTVLVFVILFATACSTQDSPGQATATISTVPSDVQCIRVVANSGAQKVEQDHAVPSGGSDVTLALAGLPVGDIVFSGTAYANTTCSGDPTWEAEPTYAFVAAGEIAQVALHFHRAGGATIGIDFDDGGCAPDAGTCGCAPDAGGFCGSGSTDFAQPQADLGLGSSPDSGPWPWPVDLAWSGPGSVDMAH